MNRKELVDILKKLLKTDLDLHFLMKLDEEEIKSLVAIVRERVDQAGK